MLKLIISILFVIPIITTRAQGIGELAPDKPPEIFPPNAWGFDILLGESGFGLGGFYRQELSTVALTTPYSEEFFKAFGSTSVKFAAGGYVGFGANFGLDKSNLIGLNFRYYYIRFFDEGVESLEGRFNKTIGGFFVTINFGFMY